MGVLHRIATRFDEILADAEIRRRRLVELRRRRVGVTATLEPRLYVSPRTRSGIYVDHDIALTYSAIWACVRIISETLAALPWNVDRQRAGGGRERAEGHPVDSLLNTSANSETTAFDFKQAQIAWVLTWGNGYAEIDRDSSGNPVALWQLPPDRVEAGRDDNNRLAYVVKPVRGDDVTLPPADVLHFRGLGWDGVRGYDVISYAAQNIGLGLGMERFGADFFGSGAHPAGILETDETLGEEAIDNLKSTFLSAARGQGTPVLEEGIKWKPSGIPPEAAQFLESRKLGVLDICRFYRVPPHMVADLDRATFSNIEHQAIEFVTHTIMPWAVRFEQECNAKLLPQQRALRKRTFVRINLNALLRGDIKSRYDAYHVAKQGGWLSVNDIRRLEDMNPIGDQGDVYLAPLNMVPADKFGEEPPNTPAAQPPAPGGANDNGQRRFYAPGYRKIVEDAVGRIARREAGKIEDAAARDLLGDPRWVKLFYDEHQSHMERDLVPVLTALTENVIGDEVPREIIRQPVLSWIEARSAKSCAEIENKESVEALLEHWRCQRPLDDAENLLQALELLLFGLASRSHDHAICQ
jgi:HK97 family phage portal protein